MIRVKDHNSVSEALAAAGLNFEAELRPTAYPSADGGFEYVPDMQTVVRTDTDKPLAVVSSKYRLVQHAESMQWVEQALGHGVEGVVRAVGSKDGARSFLQVRLPGGLDLPGGDQSERLLTIGNSLDGSLSLMITPTTLRLSCINQTRAFTRETKKFGIRARHTNGGIARSADFVAEVIAQAQAQHEDFELIARQLASKSVSTADVEHVFDTFAQRNAESKRGQVVEQLRQRFDSPTNAGGFGANQWTLWNTITEQINHGWSFRGKESERDGRRVHCLLYGMGELASRQALETVLAL